MTGKKIIRNVFISYGYIYTERQRGADESKIKGIYLQGKWNSI